VALINANDEAQSLTLADLVGKTVRLHPIQAASADPIVRTSSFNASTGAFFVPARTAAVFISPRAVADQVGLLIGDVNALMTAGALSAGNANALAKKLEAARRAIQRGDSASARDALASFISQVNAFKKSGALTADQASALIAEAQAIVAQL
jgi:alpha-1,6-glucosidase-like protein/FIMAH domain-containing protein